MRYDVVALGELLIDFTDSGNSNQGNPLFEANPGGAPGNVLAMLAKLKRKTAFIGKVGDDMFGRMMIDAVAECGIDTTGIAIDKGANTTLAFVKNAPDGDREFAFFRKPGADTLLCEKDVDSALVQNCSIFHFGSLSLTHQPVRDATRHAVTTAKKAGALISFDPNLRVPLWADLNDAKVQMDWGCTQCDILKIADEELAFLTGHQSLELGVKTLRERYPNLRIFFVTKGKAGAEGFWGSHHFCHPSFMTVKTIDTTGAGDTFCGCCLAHILNLDINMPSADKLAEMVTFSNAAASIITSRKGALRCMPTREETLELMGSVQQ